MRRGFLSLVLHAHLPYVKHPEKEDSLEGRWLFQAITECYIPILESFERLVNDNVPFRVAVSLSPPLLEMLSDPLLLSRYEHYLEVLRELADKEIFRTRDDPRLNALAIMYKAGFERLLDRFLTVYGRDLVAPWKQFEEMGVVELLSTAATHGYLPLLLHKEAVQAQVKAGLTAFRRHFGHSPEGFWLPECAYSGGVEAPLKEQGITNFILETHGVLFASPRPRFGFHAPILTRGGILAFGRDPDCSKQVWSAEEGYPGDGAYREFYRDIGYDLPLEYLGDALPEGVRAPTGIKYHRVTDRKSDYKDLYDPHSARAKAWEHARNFVFWRDREAEHWKNILGREPIMVAPYDAELFGHWWYEGPLWLEYVFRALAENPTLKAITPSEYRGYYPINQIAEPAVSSWGHKGYHEVWLEGSNDWIYRHLHDSQERLINISTLSKNARGLGRRALSQASREMLLAESSDWPFIMKTGSVVGYAKERFAGHISRLQRLLDEIEDGSPDPEYLKELELKDSVFEGIDLADLFAASGV